MPASIANWDVPARCRWRASHFIGLCSQEFRHLLAQAELIIAKGQANYESLSGTTAPIFFLLQAKCPVIAQNLAVPVKSIVLKQGDLNFGK